MENQKQKKPEYSEAEIRQFVNSGARDKIWKNQLVKQMDSEYIMNALKMVIRTTDNGSKSHTYYSHDGTVWIEVFQKELYYRKACEILVANKIMTEEDLDIPKIPMKIFFDSNKL